MQSALTRQETWPKVYSDAFNLRKAEVRQRDEAERLTSEDFQSFVDSDKAKEIRSQYEMVVANNPLQAVDINTFAELRDYLLLLLVITASGQRCGAVGNLTIENGVRRPDNLYVTKTLRHKTAAGGQAKLLWDGDLMKMALIKILSRFSICRQRSLPVTLNRFFSNLADALTNVRARPNASKIPPKLYTLGEN